MKIIRFFKRLFRGRSPKYEVWDTSALSNHFELFRKKLQFAKDTILVIPEGVSHEISVGRRTHDNCKEIYKFIEGNVRNPRLIIDVTNDSTRSWTVDEQVIHTANKYYNKGYNTLLITCDRDQSFRAKLKDIDVKLMEVFVKEKEAETPKEPVVEKQNNVPLVVPVESEKPKATNKEIKLNVRVEKKQCYLEFNKDVSIYDSRGKRKIFKQEGIPVTRDDVLYFKNEAYMLDRIENNMAIFKQK